MLKRSVSSKANSIVRHEMYFDGLALEAPDQTDEARATIEDRFGSMESWSHEFMESAKAAAGWAMPGTVS